MEEKYKILIVDDEQSILDMLKLQLEFEGYSVYTASSAKEALDKLSYSPDIILLDINMAGMNGLALCVSIRDFISCPIIFLTARVSEQDKINGLMAGGDDYITKPYNPTILLLRINALLKRATASSANNSTFYRGMEILPQKGVIKYNDGRDEMLLTKNEMTIFMCLLAKKDRIVSRDELMTELWNNEEYLNDNALTVNISRLRARFKDIGIEDVIETRKGQGYILV
mgnify:CR=1 FL=1